MNKNLMVPPSAVQKTPEVTAMFAPVSHKIMNQLEESLMNELQANCE